MTNALAIYEQMGQLQTAATAMHASGFFSDVKTQAQAMVKVMAGAELGLPPFASMSGIHIIQGKPVLGANLIATMVKNSGRYDYRVLQRDAKACVIEWRENGRGVGNSSFTIDEAQVAGLAGKDNWKKFPSDMLFARALTRGARTYAPGIFGGAPVYTPDEMGVDTDEDGHIIEGEIVTVQAAPVQAQPAQVADDDALYYADGTPVADNALATYAAYVDAHDGKAPKNVFNLRNWDKSRSGNAIEVKYCANGAVVRNGALRAFNAYVTANGHVPESVEELQGWAASFKAEQAAQPPADEAPEPQPAE